MQGVRHFTLDFSGSRKHSGDDDSIRDQVSSRAVVVGQKFSTRAETNKAATFFSTPITKAMEAVKDIAIDWNRSYEDCTRLQYRAVGFIVAFTAVCLPLAWTRKRLPMLITTLVLAAILVILVLYMGTCTKYSMAQSCIAVSVDCCRLTEAAITERQR